MGWGKTLHPTDRGTTPACWLPPDKLQLEFKKMEKLTMGIIHRSDSQWASLLHMVPKSSGRCRDFRRLNDVTILM